MKGTGVSVAWAVMAMVLAACAGWSGAADGAGEIRLLVRADDMGVARSANEACIRAYREGIARSVEVMVPGQWFLDAARMCNENPGLDVGVHLTLTSEWERCKWRPLTAGRSLVDENGYFHATNAAFLKAKPDLGEVEAELRAQIELARKHIRNVTHLSAHMGTPTITPEQRALVQRLAKEYGLILEMPAGTRGLGVWKFGASAEEKEAALVAALEKLGPGTWLFIEHPGLDTDEMRGMGHPGYENVAEDRAGVTRAMVSARAKAAIKRRGIHLVNYREAAGAGS